MIQQRDRSFILLLFHRSECNHFHKKLLGFHHRDGEDAVVDEAVVDAAEVEAAVLAVPSCRMDNISISCHRHLACIHHTCPNILLLLVECLITITILLHLIITILLHLIITTILFLLE